MERKNLNLRSWIKRLTRKTNCFSKSNLVWTFILSTNSTHYPFIIM
ncbi:MAG: hypothetical protein KAH20_07480 [Methylococcales bacterium]|nr:hypothetical protein [Methylococcales bacterium]